MEQKTYSKKKSLKIIDQSQCQLWQIGEELDAYAVLLKHLDLEEIQSGRLFGLGLSLERIHKKLQKVRDGLSPIRNEISEENKD